MIEITARAAEAVQAVMARVDGQAAGLRITAQKEGCSGLNYSMGLVSEGLETDFVLSSPLGITLFIEKDSFSHLVGSTLDYVENETGARSFSFTNPNHEPGKSCSCDKSSCSSC